VSYPFVQAHFDLGLARGPRLGFVIHMAEGGGTVGYLAGPNAARGVSVHFVIEYSGRTVQMLRLDHMHSSLNPTLVRTSDDADGFFGRTAAEAVMGIYADTQHSLGPNHASIAVEIEGFAKDGPNPAQQDALAELVSFLHATYPDIQLLGHRDFQDYKPCPGRHIDWDRLGGHATSLEKEPDMEWTAYIAKGEDWRPSVRADANDAPVRLVPDRAAPIAVRLPATATIRTIAEFTRDGESWRITRLADGRTGFLIRGDLVPVTPGGDPAVDKPLLDYVQRVAAPADTTPYSQADLDAAVAADRQKARIVYS
jgi:hypothetical protein